MFRPASFLFTAMSLCFSFIALRCFLVVGLPADPFLVSRLLFTHLDVGGLARAIEAKLGDLFGLFALFGTGRLDGFFHVHLQWFLRLVSFSFFVRFSSVDPSVHSLPRDGLQRQVLVGGRCAPLTRGRRRVRSSHAPPPPVPRSMCVP